ncbi:MAG: radical SAM protein [Phycisphaerales bacterium]
MIARSDTADAPNELRANPRAPAEHPRADALDEGFLADVASGNARLTPEQALELYRRAPLMTLGRNADARARALHGDTLRTYVIDRNINYTNICNARCTFCAFRRDGDEHDAYTLEYADILAKIAELHAIGGTQILMQGGMNPALPLDWYLGLLRTIKREFPSMHIHAFSPPEFIEFVHFFDPPGDLRDKIKCHGPPQGRRTRLASRRRRRDLRPPRPPQDRPRQMRRQRVAHLHERRPRTGHVHQRHHDVRPHRGPRRLHPSHAPCPPMARTILAMSSSMVLAMLGDITRRLFPGRSSVKTRRSGDCANGASVKGIRRPATKSSW